MVFFNFSHVSDLNSGSKIKTNTNLTKIQQNDIYMTDRHWRYCRIGHNKDTKPNWIFLNKLPPFDKLAMLKIQFSSFYYIVFSCKAQHWGITVVFYLSSTYNFLQLKKHRPADQSNQTDTTIINFHYTAIWATERSCYRDFETLNE